MRALLTTIGLDYMPDRDRSVKYFAYTVVICNPKQVYLSSMMYHYEPVWMFRG